MHQPPEDSEAVELRSKEQGAALGSRRVWPMMLIGVGLTAVALYLAYVALAAYLLRFGGAESFTEGADDVFASSQSGGSYWPGVFHATEVELRFKDRNVELQLQAKEAEFELALLPLLSRRVVLQRVTARGVRYRMLHRVHDGKSQAARIEAFPDIPGFERPVVYESEAPPDKGGGKNWSVEVKRLDARASEVWLLEYRLQGDLWASGGFSVGKKVRIAKCRAQLANVDVSVAGKSVAKAEGHLQAAIDEFASGAPLKEVMPLISGQGNLELQVDSLSPVALYLPAVEAEGRAQVSAQGVLQRGRFIAGKAEVELDDVRAEIAAQGVAVSRLSGTLTASTARAGDWLSGGARLNFDGVRWSSGEFASSSTGTLVADCSGTRAMATCDELAVRLSRVVAERASRDPIELWVSMTATEAQTRMAAGGFDGRFVMAGSDPKPLFRLLADESWPQQMSLSLINTGAWEGTLQLVKVQHTLVAHLSDFEAGAIEAKAHLVVAEEAVAALWVDTALANWGISKRGDQMKLHPLVGDDWLESQVDEMGR